MRMGRFEKRFVNGVPSQRTGGGGAERRLGT
jgi:hypothetical protein